MKDRHKTRRIIFHHSLSHGGDVAAIREWHIAKGYSDCGYHYVITRDGEIQTGRPLRYIGAHSLGRNVDSIGVCLIGDFRCETPTMAQLDSVVRLVHDISHIIMSGWEHPLKIEFHRPHVFNLFEPSEYGRFDACPGKLLDRADFLEIAMRGYL